MSLRLFTHTRVDGVYLCSFAVLLRSCLLFLTLLRPVLPTFTFKFALFVISGPVVWLTGVRVEFSPGGDFAGPDASPPDGVSVWPVRGAEAARTDAPARCARGSDSGAPSRVPSWSNVGLLGLGRLFLRRFGARWQISGWVSPLIVTASLPKSIITS